jgi:hypothetical protein
LSIHQEEVQQAAPFAALQVAAVQSESLTAAASPPAIAPASTSPPVPNTATTPAPASARSLVRRPAQHPGDDDTLEYGGPAPQPDSNDPLEADTIPIIDSDYDDDDGDFNVSSSNAGPSPAQQSAVDREAFLAADTDVVPDEKLHDDAGAGYDYDNDNDDDDNDDDEYFNP